MGRSTHPHTHTCTHPHTPPNSHPYTLTPTKMERSAISVCTHDVASPFTQSFLPPHTAAQLTLTITRRNGEGLEPRLTKLCQEKKMPNCAKRRRCEHTQTRGEEALSGIAAHIKGEQLIEEEGERQQTPQTHSVLPGHTETLHSVNWFLFPGILLLIAPVLHLFCTNGW